LLDPELLLDQALACGDLRGLQPALGLDRLQTAALLSRPTLLAQELAAQVKHADAVAQPQPFPQQVRLRQGGQDLPNERICETCGNGLAGSLQPADGVVSQTPEGLQCLLADQ